jgi:hypothetical protein
MFLETKISGSSFNTRGILNKMREKKYKISKFHLLNFYLSMIYTGKQTVFNHAVKKKATELFLGAIFARKTGSK